MTALEIVQRYFNAWNRHNISEILATFSDHGTYMDPLVDKPQAKEALSDSIRRLFIAFPNLSFELTDLIHQNDKRVAAQWLLKGSNTGTFYGYSSTQREVNISGSSFFHVEMEKIYSVQTYYDSKSLELQLGLQFIVQPFESGVFRYGTATQVQTGKWSKPQAFSITCV